MGPLEDIGKTLVSFFRGVFEAIPQILVVACVLGWGLIHAYYYFFKGGGSPPDLLTGLLEAILAGGFFAWLTKSIAFRKIIRDELHQLIYLPKHLDLRADKLQLLRNTFIANGVPSPICDVGVEPVLAFMFTQKRPYFVRGLYREVRFDWVDAAKGLITIVITHRYSLIKAVAADEIFPVRGTLSSNVMQTGIVEPKFRRVSVDRIVAGQPRVNVSSTLPTMTARAPKPGVPHLWDWEIPIPDGREFALEIVWEGGHDIDEDNSFMYQTPIFADGLELKVVYPSLTMNVQFAEVSGVSPLFDDEQKSRDELRVQCRKLLLPGHGYILTVQRCPPPAPA